MIKDWLPIRKIIAAGLSALVAIPVVLVWLNDAIGETAAGIILALVPVIVGYLVPSGPAPAGQNVETTDKMPF